MEASIEPTTNAILLLADISGWTKFVRRRVVSASHSRQIVVRLLRAIIAATEPPLTVAELEGDAVFLYALGDPGDLDEVAAQVKAQIPRLFRAFAAEMRLLSTSPRCSCEACSSVERLRLKQVVHAGEVALEQIGKFEKLFGLDVIIVHRMLKNSVEAKQYLMISEPAYEAMDGFYGLEPEERVEKLKGVGRLETRVFDEEQIAEVIRLLESEGGRLPEPSLGRVIKWRLNLMARSLLALAAGTISRVSRDGTV
ncbi:MAG: hypothetical protein BMS9Abin29_0275 [Gemmatimonadota bacterium]|nr:MAG: hypothetical protein BMS9Abin29_0275 [Gemmatimonadota bacterium]